MDFCFATLKRYLEDATDEGRSSKIIKAMMAMFSGQYLDDFAHRIINKNILKRGRIHSITKLNFYLVSPYVLLDAIFFRFDADALRISARMFPRQDVMEVMVFAAENFERFDAVENRLKKLKEYDGADFAALAPSWKPRYIRRLIVAACKVIGEDPPKQTVPVAIAMSLPQLITSYERHEIEEQDFVPIFRSVVGKDETHIESGLHMVAGHCPCLAAYLANCLGLPPRPSSSRFEPSCAQPFNKELHALGETGEVVIRDRGDVRNFRDHLDRADFYAVDLHTCEVIASVEERLGVAAFCFRSKVFLAMPYLFPETVTLITDALRRFRGKVLRYRWYRGGKFFESAFGFVPTNTVDAEATARAKGIGPSLDEFAEKVVGGKHCRRASNFGDLAIPSAVAQRHQAIRARLIFDFVRKMEGLEERERKRDFRDERKRRHERDETFDRSKSARYDSRR